MSQISWNQILATRLFGPLLIAATGVGLAAWSWAKWPDVLIDYGQTLYVAWQLAEGKVLYQDLAFNFGPLAPYLSALWFKLFGTNMLTLVFTNLLILCGIVAFLYRMIAIIANRMTATVGCVTFLCAFGFGHWIRSGNDNFVTPYEASATYGMFFALATLDLFARYMARERRALLIGAGICLGLTFLTKAEIFLACAAAVTVGLLCQWWIRRASPRDLLREVCVVTASFLVGPAASVMLLSRHMSLEQAFLGTLGSWPTMFVVDISNEVFYRTGMGIDDIPTNSLRLLIMCGWHAVALLFGLAVAFLFRKKTNKSVPQPGNSKLALSLGITAFIVINAIGWIFHEQIPWRDWARPLPVVTLVAAIVSLRKLAKRDGQIDQRSIQTIKLVFSTFAFVLLWKMILFARIWHYGFVLAMPATMLLIVVAVNWIPAWINRHGGRGQLFTAMALAAVTVLIHGSIRISGISYERKNVAVSSGPDAILADNRGHAVNAVLDYFSRYSEPEQTVVAIPEGVMLNYLSRRANPTRFHNFNPFEVHLHGENIMLQSLLEASPHFIVLVHKDTKEFGYRYFGRNYGQAISSWVRQNYRPVLTEGAIPLNDGRFGIMILKRLDLDED